MTTNVLAGLSNTSNHELHVFELVVNVESPS